MSSLFSELGGITGGVGSEALAFAAGFAAARALEPAGVTIAQDAWNTAQVKRLDPGIAAEAAAEGYASEGAMATEATYSGYDASRFAALYNVTLTAPGIGVLLEMLRHETINDGNFAHGLRKSKFEPMWDDALAELKTVRLSPQQIALGIVRSVVRDPGLLATTLDVSGGVVPAYPVWEGDALKEALAGGVDAQRLRVMVGEIGLPMSAQQAASAYFREIIHLPDFNRAILEGDTRPEWAPFILEQARAILSPHEYEEAALRGVVTRAQADAGAAKHGMTAADAQILFDIQGRPIAVHGITTGIARGGEFGGTYDDIPEPYRDAVRRSNIRPEYAKLAYANRYNYPSAFVLRSLTQTGEITEQDAHETLLKLGWEPSFAEKVSKAWSGGTASKGDTHITKAETQVWTALHKSYVDNLSTDAETTADLQTLGVAEASQPEVLKLWQVEREIVRRSLTPAQIKKAIGEPGKDAAWAKTRLIALGYSPEDADTFLAE